MTSGRQFLDDNSPWGGGEYFRAMLMIPHISVPVLYLRVKMIIISYFDQYIVLECQYDNIHHCDVLGDDGEEILPIIVLVLSDCEFENVYKLTGFCSRCEDS